MGPDLGRDGRIRGGRPSVPETFLCKLSPPPPPACKTMKRFLRWTLKQNNAYENLAPLFLSTLIPNHCKQVFNNGGTNKLSWEQCAFLSKILLGKLSYLPFSFQITLTSKCSIQNPLASTWALGKGSGEAEGEGTGTIKKQCTHRFTLAAVAKRAGGTTPTLPVHRTPAPVGTVTQNKCRTGTKSP